MQSIPTIVFKVHYISNNTKQAIKTLRISDCDFPGMSHCNVCKAKGLLLQCITSFSSPFFIFIP